ncbi:MAG: hypothetical protein QY309_09055 [Cyclobacteriaceae bacterium]|jgi:hypothetical protein|nr:MAG: hypothetical protein QY309_09055 [Cyclobacteriaceae bacterium]
MKTRALICLFLLLSVMVWAQPGDPGGDPDVPLTGIEWLLLAGGALGIKRFLSRKKEGN